MYNIVPVQWFWTVQPVNLLLHIFIQSGPLLTIIFRWELPEYFFQALIKNWIPKLKNDHCNDEYVDEIECKWHHLLFVYTNTKHITKWHMISKHSKVEEQW